MLKQQFFVYHFLYIFPEIVAAHHHQNWNSHRTVSYSILYIPIFRCVFPSIILILYQTMLRLFGTAAVTMEWEKCAY